LVDNNENEGVDANDMETLRKDYTIKSTIFSPANSTRNIRPLTVNTAISNTNSNSYIKSGSQSKKYLRPKSLSSIFNIKKADSKIPWTPDSNYDNDLYNNFDAEYAEKKNDYVDNASVRNIDYSKNKDKLLIKKGVVIKMRPDDVRGITNLLHQTNNLILYRSRMKSKNSENEYKKDNNIQKVQSKSLNKQFERLKKVHRLVEDKTELNLKVQTGINNKIDLLINKLGNK